MNDLLRTRPMIDPLVNVANAWMAKAEVTKRAKDEVFRAGDDFTRDLPADEAIARMDACGIVKAVVGVDPEDPLPWVLDFATEHPDRFALAVEPRLKHGLDALWAMEDLCTTHRVVSVRVAPMFLGRRLSDPRYHPLFVKCIELGLPLCATTGIPGPAGLPADLQHPMELDPVLLEFPQLRVVMLHGADPWWSEAIRLLRRHRNLWMCTSAWPPSRLPEELLRYLRGRRLDEGDGGQRPPGRHARALRRGGPRPRARARRRAPLPARQRGRRVLRRPPEPARPPCRLSLPVRWGTELVARAVRGAVLQVHADRPRSIGALLDDAVARHPDEPFLVQGDVVRSRTDLRASGRAVAAGLAARGVAPGDRVLLLAANSPAWVEALFGIVLAGAVPVLGNGWWPADDVDHAVRVTGAAVALTDERRAASVPDGVTVLPLDGVAGAGGAPAGRRVPRADRRGRARPDPVHVRHHRVAQGRAAEPPRRRRQRPPPVAPDAAPARRARSGARRGAPLHVPALPHERGPDDVPPAADRWAPRVHHGPLRPRRRSSR